jgi:purine-nucleoside phosphorylase
MQIFQRILDKYAPAAKSLTGILGGIPKTAVIAGSGIADTLDTNKILLKIPYSKLPGIPKLSVQGHNGEVLIYAAESKTALVFSGRFHFYEGRTYDEICSLVIISYLAGIRKIIISNAAGGLNPLFVPGEIMLIEDYIDFMFLDSSSVFDSFSPAGNISDNIINKLYHCSIRNSLIHHKIPFRQGTYAAVTGPNYETRAEIKMLRRLKADAVGMSTVPELRAAAILGMETAAFSLITNSAKEVIQSVSHKEVIEAAEKSALLVRRFIETAV